MPKRITDILFILLAAISVWYVSQKPIYNWDMIEYMGVALSYTDHNDQEVHDIVYNSLKKEVPPEIYNGLTKNIEERKDCLTNVKVFDDQMSFFRTKPLYTFCVFLLYKAHVPLVIATLVPSIIAAFVMLLIIYFWLSTFLQKGWAFILGLLFMCLPVFHELNCYSTPDGISNMFILLSLYLLATKYAHKWSMTMAGISVIARIDNFIYAAVLGYFLFLRKSKNLLVSLFIIVVLSIAVVIGIPMLLGDNANWFTKFAFLFSVHDYIHHWRDVIYLVRTNGLYLLLIGIVIWMYFKAEKTIVSTLQIIILTIAVHMLLFPSLQERFFGAYEFAILILFIQYLKTQFKTIPPLPTLKQTQL